MTGVRFIRFFPSATRCLSTVGTSAVGTRKVSSTRLEDGTVPYIVDPHSAPKPGMPEVARDTINAIVYNPTTGEVLCLDWKDHGWRTFVIGGINKGEDPIQAALREIAEETGYTDLKLIGELGRYRSSYYAEHKKENRIAHVTALLFILRSNKNISVPSEESAKHEIVWMPTDRVLSFVTIKTQQVIWKWACAMLSEIEKDCYPTGENLPGGGDGGEALNCR